MTEENYQGGTQPRPYLDGVIRDITTSIRLE